MLGSVPMSPLPGRAFPVVEWLPRPYDAPGIEIV
jgi:hypothetical protein